MSKKQKKPSWAFTPHPERKPVAVELHDYNQALPRWRFSKIDWAGPYGWSAVDPDTLKQIAVKLAGFETMTWGELQKSGKHTTATEIEIGSFDKDGQRRLAEIFEDDVASLWELHLGGQQRLWGIRDRDVYYFVWWDPKHLVCPSHKRHT